MPDIAALLGSARIIAVVGLSSKRYRPSHGVAEYMKHAGYRIIPVNPHETEVLGEKSYAKLEDIPEHIDIVDIFRRSEYVPELVDAAIRIGAKAIWMQEGVVQFLYDTGRNSDIASVDSTRLRSVATPRQATASGSAVTCRGSPKNDEFTSWRILAASAGSRHTTAAISAAPQLGDSRAAVRSP